MGTSTGLMKTPLSHKEKEILKWMYENTEHWKGGLDPGSYTEYDEWLFEARQLLLKLGVKIEYNQR